MTEGNVKYLSPPTITVSNFRRFKAFAQFAVNGVVTTYCSPLVGGGTSSVRLNCGELERFHELTCDSIIREHLSRP